MPGGDLRSQYGNTTVIAGQSRYGGRMTDFRSVSTPVTRSRSRRRVAVAIATAAIAALAAAGCSSAAGSSGSSGSSGGQPASAIQAIQLASDQAQKINSMDMSINEHLGSSTVTGTIQAQLKPTILMQEDLSVSTSGTALSMSAIITDQVFYLKIPQLTGLTGKPWAKITVSQLSTKTGLNLAQAFQQAENLGPSTTSRLFTASKDVHKVGTATIDGVATTEYAGTYTPADAIKQLPASLSKQMSSLLNSMGTSPVSFQVWIDGGNVMRKMVENLTIAGQSAVITINVTSVNQPVNIVLPPASQVAAVPGL